MFSLQKQENILMKYLWVELILSKKKIVEVSATKG